MLSRCLIAFFLNYTSSVAKIKSLDPKLNRENHSLTFLQTSFQGLRAFLFLNYSMFTKDKANFKSFQAFLSLE
jgi:hypothetical protein